MTSAKTPEADLDSLLDSEEIAALGEDPRRKAIRLIAWGGLLLALASIGSWLWREARSASTTHQGRIATFATIRGRAADASASELLEMNARWAGQVEQGRGAYKPKSNRGREFEVAAAASGVALSTAVIETLARPGALDLGDQIRLALGLKRIVTDSSVLAISRMDPRFAGAALLDVVQKGATYLSTLTPRSTLDNIAQGAAVAGALAAMAPAEQRTAYLAMADSLQEEVSRRIDLGDRGDGTGPSGTGAEKDRDDAAAAIKEYLKSQGVAVTFTGAEGPGRKHLVIKGLGSTSELGVLITANPQAMRRLGEAGFTEVRAAGTSGREVVTPVPSVPGSAQTRQPEQR